jgi:ABC-2 type transport system permease protein
MVLKGNNQIVQIPMRSSISGLSLDSDIKDGLKRFSKGYMKTVGICGPDPTSAYSSEGLKDFALLKDKLAAAYTVEDVSLAKGKVDSTVDLLLLLAPEKLKDIELFAVDQFLMRGGTIVMATNSFSANLRDKITCTKDESGLNEWLKKNGIEIGDSMVLDKVNFPLPLPVVRRIGSYTVNETALLPYPYFVDVRREGLGEKNSFTAGIDEILMSWASPITVDAQKNKGRKITDILSTSPAAWTSDSTHIEPHMELYPQTGFPEPDKRGKQLLGVAVEGTFNSYFEKRIPPEPPPTPVIPGHPAPPQPPATEQMPKSVIGKSPESARIIIYSSPTFLSDRITKMASQSLGALYLKSIDLLENSVDWCLSDRDLLSIRGRSAFTRVLQPIDAKTQPIFEYMNYALALAGLSAVWVIRKRVLKRSRKRYSQLLQELAATKSLEEASKS